MSEIVKGILRAVSSALQIPTIIILILLILLTIIMLGSILGEAFSERRALKLNIPKLVDELQGKASAQMKDVIEASGLLKRQKAAVQELISRVNYPDDTREALARQLIADEEMRYGKITKITDLIARVAPMFGLMGTLIPLGPGLIALGEGDAATLADSLLIAFDTTVAGLIAGAVSYVISGIRKGWYEQYMIGLETVMETVLDVQNTERRKVLQSAKAKQTAAAGSVSANTGQLQQTMQSPDEKLRQQIAAQQLAAQQAAARQQQAAAQQLAQQQLAAQQQAAAAQQAAAQQQAAARQQMTAEQQLAAQQAAARRQAAAQQQAAAQRQAAAQQQAIAQQQLAAQQQAAARQQAAMQQAAQVRAAQARAAEAQARTQQRQVSQTAETQALDELDFDDLLQFFDVPDGRL